MSVRKLLNLSSSSLSLSELSSEDDPTSPVKKVGAEGVGTVGSIPGPSNSNKRTKRSPGSVSSGSSLASPGSTPSKSKSESDKPGPSSKHREKDRCDRLGLNIDDDEFEDIDAEDEDMKGNPLDNVIDDLLNLGLGIKRNKKTDDKAHQNYTRLAGHTPLQFTEEGRLSVLNNDVETVRKTKEAIDALITVLETTKEKLISEDTSLTFTQPPAKLKKEKPKINANIL